MARRLFAPAAAATIALLSLAPLTAQSPRTKAWNPPRTADGQPDLQGVWDFRTITPLERPSVFAGKEVLTDEEVAEVEEQKAKFDAADPADRRNVNPGFSTARNLNDRVDEQAYNSLWFDNGTKVIPSRRTSLIVEPKDGQIPYTAAGRARATRPRGTDGPEDRGLTERCILSLNAGPPLRPSAYNNNLQIVQTRGHVAIYNEMIHDVRIIPLDGRPHVGRSIRQWRGDSRGRWEGATLVVETRNFSEKTLFSGSSEDLRLVERFTRVGPDTLNYEFTVEDPKSYVRPWTAAFPMTRTDAPMYEYACHEGNYGMTNLLSGARAQEKAAAAKTKP
jgi:hypothetical protein